MNRTTLALLLLALVACVPRADDQAANAPVDDAPATADAPTNRVRIPAAVRRNLDIRFATVEARSVEATLRVPGAFELQPLARREVRLALPGRVELHVDEYASVERGDLLFRYRSPEWSVLLHEIVESEQQIRAARAEIAVAEASFAETERRLDAVAARLEALARLDVMNADLELVAAELDASLPRRRAELEAARTTLVNAVDTRAHALHRAAAATGLTEAALDAEVVVDGEELPAYRTIDWIEVRAEAPGVVEHLAVTDGAFVERHATVLTTVDPTRVRFVALALQADLARLARASDATIVPPEADGAPLGDPIPAAFHVGLDARSDARTVDVVATPEAMPQWARAGVAAFLEVVTAGTGTPSLAVPRAAIVRDGLTHVLFRRDPADPDQAIRIEADMGASDGRWVALESGVIRGDEVVVDGAYELKLATQRAGGGQAGGHFHADGSFHDEH